MSVLEFKVNSMDNIPQDLEEIKKQLNIHEDNLKVNNASIDECKIIKFIKKF